MTIRTWIALAVLSAALPAGAGTGVMVTGTVADETGGILPGVTVAMPSGRPSALS